MRNVFLSLLVVGALAIAGIGGTLADFSDSEEEIGDTLQAGSMDLKVDGKDDPHLLPASIRGMVPEKSYHIQKTVSNDGTIDGWLYIHIKNVGCTETNDKDLNGDGVINLLDNPEPENVAELGGKHGQEQVPGVGVRCDMEKHIEVEIDYDGNPVSLSSFDVNQDGKVTLDELECNQILIDQLEACGAEHTFRIGFILIDVPEEYYQIDIFDVNNPNEVMFNWWPTNCYMGDTVNLDILFELLQTDYEPPAN
jgi:predicted ribosomally synthesized peptide with SipW-like signal peptide